jgi:hypothetical protein
MYRSRVSLQSLNVLVNTQIRSKTGFVISLAVSLPVPDYLRTIFAQNPTLLV